MRLVRRPCAPLRPFVTRLWALDQRRMAACGARWERVLPTGDMHLAIRLAGDPLRLRDACDSRYTQTVGPGVIGGPRTAPYLRDVSRPGWSVGAQLRPGAAAALFGPSASAFAGHHADLDLLWGGDGIRLREILAEEEDPSRQLDTLEAALLARLSPVRCVHPVVAGALRRFRSSADVRAAVAASGYGHRRFIELFREQVGLTPKVYCRIRRFQRVLRLAGQPLPWASIAAATGYSDQAHLQREFREFAGLTPGAHRALEPPVPHHVPLIAGVR
jgi:AraC-like DNA-binding protein